jgi:putative transferase (TIGR04331 family)
VVKRFLITTALEQTWRQDAPVLFLGEWCRRYDRRHIWESMDAQVAPYHWDDRAKLYQDYLYLRDLHEGLLIELAERLNAIHGVDHSNRYWRMLLGPWLGYFVQMVFDRWSMLQRAFSDHEISGVRIVARQPHQLIPADMEEFIGFFLGDDWNEQVYGELLDAMRIPVETVDPVMATSDLGSKGARARPNSIQKIKRQAGWLASKLSKCLCSDREYVFVSSYLPKMQDLLLQLRLGQLPKFWRFPDVLPSSLDMAVRREFGDVVKPEGGDFMELARYMVCRHVPRAYLEGYHELVSLTQSLGLPEYPRAIFTANGYSSDDVFKAWAAGKIESGTPLLIGQHGGNYGVAKWGFTEEHQISVADRFLTWGWTEPDSPALVAVGNLKGFGKRQSTDAEGGALLIQMSMPQNSYHMYSVAVSSQWLSYFEDQCRFVEALAPKVRQQLLVRLYKADYGWFQRDRWQERFPSVRLDSGQSSMSELISRSRICISTYNATTYLESISLNIPTVMFWNPDHWELRDSAMPYFEELASVGIFHSTPESAARHLSEIWDDVSDWWDSEDTVRVRRIFCDRYARIPENALGILAGVLRETAASPSFKN